MISLVAASTLFAVTHFEAREIRGTVSYRERSAMPIGAELYIRLDQSGGNRREMLSEVTMRTGSQQVPITFSLPFQSVALRPNDKYTVYSEIRVNGRAIYRTQQYEPVISNGRYEVNLNLIRTGASASSSAWSQVTDRDWDLYELNSRMVTLGSRPVSINFGSRTKSLSGFTGVNRFSGSYTLTGDKLNLTPGSRTMMAGSPEQARLEYDFIAMLNKADGYKLYDYDLALTFGDQTIAKFRMR